MTQRIHQLERKMRIKRTTEPAWCGHQCVEFAQGMGFEPKALAELTIVVRELVSNVIRYAGHGQLTIRRIVDPRPGVELSVEDDGPGIEDIDAAMQDGYSQGRLLADADVGRTHPGLGAGLGAAERLSDGISVVNRSEGGVRVVALKLLPE